MKYFVLDSNAVNHFILLLECFCLQQLFLHTQIVFFPPLLYLNSKGHITMDSTQEFFSKSLEYKSEDGEFVTNYCVDKQMGSKELVSQSNCSHSACFWLF